MLLLCQIIMLGCALCQGRRQGGSGEPVTPPPLSDVTNVSEESTWPYPVLDSCMFMLHLQD